MPKKTASTPEAAPVDVEPVDVTIPVSQDTPAEPAAAPDTPVAAAPESTPKADDGSPKTMLEAIEQGLAGDAKATPAVKAAADAAKGDAEKVTADKAAKDGKDKDDDLLAMPEGLSESGQKRFHKLVNSNKELSAKLGESDATLQEFQGIMAEAGVQQPQFEQAVDYIGLVNRGDLEGALQLLDRERRQIAVLLGRPLAQVDALTDFPDLRKRVDTMDLSEQDALELARNRSLEDMRRRSDADRQSQQQQAQDSQQQRDAALTAVDAYLTQQSKNDLDFTRKEALISKRVVEMCKTLPPSSWAAAVQQAYELVGEIAAPAPTPNTVTVRPLRPTGGGGKPAPKNMHEAIWGSAA